MKRLSTFALHLLVLTMAPLAFAPPAYTQTSSTPRVDLGVSFVGERSLEVNSGSNFWMQGGSAEFGADLWHGLGAAANLTGTHTSSVASGGVPLSVITVAFGPRYRFRPKHHVSPYGEMLLGVAHGFDSKFPLSDSTSKTSASSLAIEIGGGIDYRFRTAFSVRLLEAAWVRTQLPNAANDRQNTLRLGAGFVFNFR